MNENEKSENRTWFLAAGLLAKVAAKLVALLPVDISALEVLSRFQVSENMKFAYDFH
jgi:hypothetical protein